MVDRRREGFFEPKYCPRGLDDCKALAQIIADNHESFMCCGERQDAPEARTVPQDAYRFCHKSIGTPHVDVSMNHDERDMAHIAAVYSWAIAATMPAHGEPRERVIPISVPSERRVRMNERTPAQCFPVGEFIADEMEARGWTVHDVAARMGEGDPATWALTVDLLVHCSDNDGILLDQDTANRLGRAFDVSPEFFLGLHRAYAAWRAKQRPTGVTER